MRYNIEIKVRYSEEYWFLVRLDKGYGVTRRLRNAAEFNNIESTETVITELMGCTKDEVRNLLNKSKDFDTPITFTAIGNKDNDAVTVKTRQRLYTFVDQE